MERGSDASAGEGRATITRAIVAARCDAPSVFTPTRLPNGNVLAPLRAVDDESGTVGHAMVELAPGDEQYARWDALLRAREQ